MASFFLFPTFSDATSYVQRPKYVPPHAALSCEYTPGSLGVESPFGLPVFCFSGVFLRAREDMVPKGCPQGDLF